MVDIVRLNEKLLQIGATVRVESGPVMKTAIATPENLSNDVTPDHYALGKPDKLGKHIVADQEFTYLDWNGPWGFHVYEFCTEDWTGPNTPVFDADGNPVLDDAGKHVHELGPAWRRRGTYADEMVAIAEGMQIAMKAPV